MCDLMQKPNEMRGDESLDLPSLEYIEDSYLPKLDPLVTPSLDEPHGDVEVNFHLENENRPHDTSDYYTCDWTADEAELYLRSLTLDQILDIPNDVVSNSCNTATTTLSMDELQMVETEFTTLKLAASDKLKAKLVRMFKRKSLRDVRVTFIDFSKPYLAKVSSGDNYKQFLHIHATGTEIFYKAMFHFIFIQLTNLKNTADDIE